MASVPNSPSGFSSKSPFSPRIRQKGIRTPLMPSSLKKSLQCSVSGKSVQASQVITKTSFHTVEKFGNTLPVIITEALTFADRNTVVSVRISDSGFAWLVCGRRLLVWQYRQNLNSSIIRSNSQRRAQGGQCFELTLPQSDLAHRAELVSVFLNPGCHTPSCIAVSPEGVIRYWPNVSHEGLSVEQTVDLQGQECDSLCALGGKVNGCVLATTTCTVVLVQPKLTTGGRHSLYCHTLRTPTGWLGGIGKKMSSLIFGPMATEHTGETRLVRVLSVKQSEDQWHVYVLAGQSLQKWLMSSSEPEQLLYMVEVGRVVRDAYQCTAWESCASDPSDIDLWLLDIQVYNNNIMLLSAAVNLHVSPQVQYAVIRLDANTTAPSVQTTVQIEEFLLLKIFGLYQEDNTTEFLSHRLLMCDSNIYIHRQRDITIIQSPNEPDVLDFISIGDKLLGGSLCGNTPIFFSKNHGLVAVYPTDQSTCDVSRTFLDVSATDKLNDSVGIQGSNLSLYNIEPEEIMTAQKDTVNQVKAAFLYHVKNQFGASQEILAELFPEDGEIKNMVDSILDKVVVAISIKLLDDVPTGDPRWLNEHCGLGSSSSMQIQNQLEDKQQAHNLFLQFLQQSGLWSRLSAITMNNTVLASTHVLADHSELLIAAIQLKILSTTNSTILQEAIDYAVSELYEDPKPGLTKQDVFYREISKIYRGLWALVEKCQQCVSSEKNPSHIITFILETNQILMDVLSSIMQFRQQKAVFYSPSSTVIQIPVEYLPWTINIKEYGLYDALSKQQSLTLRYGARVCTEGATKANLYDQYVSLVDVMLDARKCHVESVRGKSAQYSQRAEILLKQYQQERHNLIQPLVDDCEWERAALLAEKYLDFTVLVIICESTNNQQRLDEYLERFKDEDFGQHVFNWYLREGKQGKLLARCRAASRPSIRPTSSASLTKFLGAHPQLKWLQHAFQGDYKQTAHTLKDLALEEKELLTKKKSMLSFAKLSSLIANGDSGEPMFIEEINKQLELIQCQEEMPDDLLSGFGYDSVRQPVLDPVILAQLCVCPENQDATEYDFKKALKLANYVYDHEQKDELILHIWSSAILRDNVWKRPLCGIESPIEVISNTMFYKLTDLAITLGSRVDDILPPIDQLMNSIQLGTLKDNINFQYLIKVGYDYFFRSQNIDY